MLEAEKVWVGQSRSPQPLSRLEEKKARPAGQADRTPHSHLRQRAEGWGGRKRRRRAMLMLTQLHSRVSGRAH